MTITLLQGDCREVLPTLPAESADAVITDPPFKLSQEYGAGADADNLLAVSSIWPVAQEMFRVSKPGSICAMFYDSRILPLALEAMRHANWKYLRNLTLYRRWGRAGIVHGWMSTSDFVLIFYKPGRKPKFHGPCSHDVWVRDRPELFDAGHPAQKPVEFLRGIVRNITPPGGHVLDPFAGSGSTGIAAAREGFNATLIELSPDYLAIARRRIESDAPLLSEVA